MYGFAFNTKARMWEKCEKAEPGFCPLKTGKGLCNKLPFIPG